MDAGGTSTFWSNNAGVPSSASSDGARLREDSTVCSCQLQIVYSPRAPHRTAEKARGAVTSSTRVHRRCHPRPRTSLVQTALPRADNNAPKAGNELVRKARAVKCAQPRRGRDAAAESFMGGRIPENARQVIPPSRWRFFALKYMGNLPVFCLGPGQHGSPVSYGGSTAGAVFDKKPRNSLRRLVRSPSK